MTPAHRYATILAAWTITAPLLLLAAVLVASNL